jgi:ComF family protein
MNQIIHPFAFIREYLFPGGCALCGTPLLDGEEAWYGLCAGCRDLFPQDNDPRCSSCGRPLISEQGLCLSCREGDPFHFDGGFVLYPYAGKYRELLKAYKFGKFRPLGNFFAEKLTEALSRFLPADAASFSWVPVPPRPGKLRKTGWDQVAYLAGRLDLMYRQNHARHPSVYPCLKRLPSKAQKELNREDRKRNLQGRIVSVKEVPRRVILFDDVITTGSTLDACAAALKESGAEEVYSMCLCFD